MLLHGMASCGKLGPVICQPGPPNKWACLLDQEVGCIQRPNHHLRDLVVVALNQGTLQPTTTNKLSHGACCTGLADWQLLLLRPLKLCYKQLQAASSHAASLC